MLVMEIDNFFIVSISPFFPLREEDRPGEDSIVEGALGLQQLIREVVHQIVVSLNDANDSGRCKLIVLEHCHSWCWTLSNLQIFLLILEDLLEE